MSEGAAEESDADRVRRLLGSSDDVCGAELPQQAITIAGARVLCGKPQGHRDAHETPDGSWPYATWTDDGRGTINVIETRV